MFSQPYSLASLVVGGCWILFVMVWTIAAFRTKRSTYVEDVGGRVRYTVIILAGALILSRARVLPGFLGDPLFPRTPAWAIVAMVCSLGGLAICFWARATLGRNWSGKVTLKENHELIQRGPYRFVRHPIYTGLLTMFLASLVLVNRIGCLVGYALVFIGLWIKLRREEAVMAKQFPGQYPDYSRRVRRLIPFVW